MHSTLVRGQNVFGFFTTVAFSIAAVIAVSVFLFPQNPSAKLQMRNVQVVKGRPHYYSSKREEYAHVKFDLDMDLSSLYNWNTKQVFIWVTAKYPSESPTEPMTEAVIWDAILPSPSEPWHHNQYVHYKPSPSSSSRTLKSKKPSNGTPGILKLKGQRPKYQITDAAGKIAERANCTLELNWNVQPWVGALTWTNRGDYGLWKGLTGGRSKSFDFPGLKSKGEAAGATKEEDLKTMKGAEANRGKPA
ncbi:signal peptidase 22 kDa subunit [Rhizodiscina lignyota]|uniref:Signal peptidase subunit 3 n=1 Tax=Rhizodiscina lignyota TaxID=1504668 RepID=A0A9P4I9X3_9PEZI|nr:signal peptidase 22 kDa subunit [Rhizodiscina lignyota]